MVFKYFVVTVINFFFLDFWMSDRSFSVGPDEAFLNIAGTFLSAQVKLWFGFFHWTGDVLYIQIFKKVWIVKSWLFLL